MRLQVLLSAMHLKDYSYVRTLNITSDTVVINQCNENNVKSIKDFEKVIKFISTTDRGLSNSRNMAIAHATADICILCDNDVEYVPDYERIVISEFKKYLDYDVIVFFIKRNIPESRPYYSRPKRLGYLSTLKVFSPEIAFRRKSIDDKMIRFKTEFGAGAKYAMGEENIFLYDCLKSDLKVLYVPKQIASLRNEESTWFKGYTEKYFLDKGAIFYEMAKCVSFIMILQFAFRKYRLYRHERSLRDALKFMFQGRRQYKRIIKHKRNEKRKQGHKFNTN